MELWHFFLEKLTLQSKTGTKGLKYDDAYLCARIAEKEGQFDTLLKYGNINNADQWKSTAAHGIQSELRRIFESTFPNEPMPKKLQPGYKPRGSMDD